MNTIRIRKKLDSTTLPELEPLIGKTVQITVEETAPAPEAKKMSREELDRLVEENAKLYGVQDVCVDIVREMRDSRHLEGDP